MLDGLTEIAGEVVEAAEWRHTRSLIRTEITSLATIRYKKIHAAQILLGREEKPVMVTAPKAEGRARGVFQITGIACPGCTLILAKELRKLKGIMDVRINYITDKAYVDYDDPAKSSLEEVKESINREGRVPGPRATADRVS